MVTVVSAMMTTVVPSMMTTEPTYIHHIFHPPRKIFLFTVCRIEVLGMGG
jgi:hypothetical protein